MTKPHKHLQTSHKPLLMRRYLYIRTPMLLLTLWSMRQTVIGAVIQQEINHEWQPIAFFSKKLTPAETKYSTFDRELLAIYYLFIKHFQYFVEGRNFYILTDHKPLTFVLQANHNHSPRQLRLSSSFLNLQVIFGISRVLIIVWRMLYHALRSMQFTQHSLHQWILRTLLKSSKLTLSLPNLNRVHHSY